ncbi:MAG: ABC transporter ATP-binding protein, partial [Xenophilus sp.]
LGARHARLPTIAGTPPSPRALPPGCRFAPRCPEAQAQCTAAYPDWFSWDEGRRAVACWRTPQRLGVPAAEVVS